MECRIWIVQNLREVCDGALDDISDEAIHPLMIFYVQRVRNYIDIERWRKMKLKGARIIPAKIPRTAVCEFYEGKIISVEDAFQAIQKYKTFTPRLYYKEITSSNCLIPPFYYECRCRMEAIIPGVDNSYKRYIPKPKEKDQWDYLSEFQQRTDA